MGDIHSVRKLEASVASLRRARACVAGGDSSTMRVLPYHPPIVAERGDGCRFWDVDGNEYIDLNMAYGPLLFGHRPKFVVDAVVEQIRERGSILGFPHRLSCEVGEKIKQLFPSIDLLRFANSGTEAVTTAVRLARAFTGRRGLLMFEGNYHGWNDAVFHRCHPALSELAESDFSPASPGTGGLNGQLHAWECQFNSLESVRSCLRRHGEEIGVIILEPAMANAGAIAPAADFLLGLRRLADEYGCLLIFDEVITGLRLAAGGAQQRYGVRPDLTVLSKALGGGFPVAAFGGRADIMEQLVQGRVFHGGVYSGNACVLAAANAVLNQVIAAGPSLYEDLDRTADWFLTELSGILTSFDLPHVVQHVGSVMSIHLTRTSVDSIESYRDAVRFGDPESFIDLQHRLVEHGVYIHPNQFEVQFLSTAHERADLEECLERIKNGVAAFAASRVAGR